MKKFVLIFLILFSTIPAFSQWITKTVDNKLDLPYRIAYCKTSDQRGLLKLESVDGELAFYLTGSYFCDDNPSVDIAFVVNGESKRYTLIGSKSSDSRTVFLYDNILSEDNLDLLSDFKKCSSVIIRINESYCRSEFYTFVMTGSSSAVEFMSK